MTQSAIPVSARLNTQTNEAEATYLSRYFNITRHYLTYGITRFIHLHNCVIPEPIIPTLKGSSLNFKHQLYVIG